jgi:hypothetical protein
MHRRLRLRGARVRSAARRRLQAEVRARWQIASRRLGMRCWSPAAVLSGAGLPGAVVADAAGRPAGDAVGRARPRPAGWRSCRWRWHGRV